MTVVIAICTVVVSISTIGDTMRTRRNRRAVEERIATLEERIARDSAFIEQISTSPEFMEKFARETYHMQRSGETVYILE
ncbi:MAG: septum formation initiator family protein [Alistipes sp.]|nr:septum formation initiator family protein [Alistipes sp.]